MKIKNLRRALIIAAIAVAMVATTAVSFAYFSDYETAMGRAVIHLTGETEIQEEWTGAEKKITIVNTGECDVIVRVGVFGPDPDGMNVTGDGWKQDGDFWYYNQVIPVGGKTSVLTASVDGLDPNLDYSEFDITVVQECQPASAAAQETPEGWAINPAKN